VPCLHVELRPCLPSVMDLPWTTIYSPHRAAAARTADADFAVEASCCEIYNEAVTDLLAGDKQRQLQVRVRLTGWKESNGCTDRLTSNCSLTNQPSTNHQPPGATGPPHGSLLRRGPHLRPHHQPHRRPQHPGRRPCLAPHARAPPECVLQPQPLLDELHDPQPRSVRGWGWRAGCAAAGQAGAGRPGGQ